MYLLQFSRYDCPGCDKLWCFDTIEEIETFVKDACPKFPETVWKPRHGFYPNGLSISEVTTGRKQVLRMKSMVDAHDFEYKMPECYSPEVEPVAKLIYDSQGIVDAMEDGEYQWPLEQITPRVDKEDLVKTVFHPDRMVRMGGPDWLECV
jgi:hypothetical protein